MKRAFYLLLVCASVCLAESMAFKGTCDKDPLSYACGEPMVFTITLVDKDAGNAPILGRKLHWERTGDDGVTESGEGISDEPLVVTVSTDKPGFVRLIVRGERPDGTIEGDNHRIFDGGAGAEIEKIPSWPIPDDFRDFWAGAMQTLYSTPYEVTLEDLDFSDKGEGWDQICIKKFSITTFPGERPSTGVIGWKKSDEAKKRSMLVIVDGYGFGATGKIDKAVVDRGDVYLRIARHGEDPCQDEAYYKSLQENEMKNFCFRNNNELYGNDFFKMIMRDQRALQWALTLPQVDASKVTVNGGSMGGYRSIALAALSGKISYIGIYIPWCADLSGVEKYGRLNGWRPYYTDVLGYFDAANFATMVTCPVSYGMGLGDYVCPPSSEVILYRNFNVKKSMSVGQNMGHGFDHGVEKVTTRYSCNNVIGVNCCDHAILWCNGPLLIAGTANPGTVIHGFLGEFEAEAETDDAGTWRLVFNDVQPGSYTLRIAIPETRIEFHDVRVKNN